MCLSFESIITSACIVGIFSVLGISVIFIFFGVSLIGPRTGARGGKCGTTVFIFFSGNFQLFLFLRFNPDAIFLNFPQQKLKNYKQAGLLCKNLSIELLDEDEVYSRSNPEVCDIFYVTIF